MDPTFVDMHRDGFEANRDTLGHSPMTSPHGG